MPDAIKENQSSRSYNPGLTTAVIMFLPAGAFAILEL